MGRGCVLARAGKLGSGRLTGFSGPGTVQAHEVDLDYIVTMEKSPEVIMGRHECAEIFKTKKRKERALSG